MQNIWKMNNSETDKIAISTKPCEPEFVIGKSKINKLTQCQAVQSVNS